MKNKKVLFFINIFIISFLLNILAPLSFAEGSEITTHSPHCILMESSTRKGYL